MKFIKDFDVAGKRVIVRVDFNVSLDEQGKILDDFKIISTLPTIKYLIDREAKIVLMSHLGNPGGKFDPKYSLNPVRERLADYLNLPVQFSSDCIGSEAQKMAAALAQGQLLMLENLRFYTQEEANDAVFAQNLAKLAEIYVNDAFAECHRDCASMTTITKFLPSYGGLLLEKEIENLSRVRDNPEHPLVVIIGGAKISTKIKLIRSFLKKADNIILGGALANTVLHAKGIAVGKSIIEEAMAAEVNKLDITDVKLHLPVDVLVCAGRQNLDSCRCGSVGLVQEGESIFDIGPDTEEIFAQVIKTAKMVIWNGSMGVFENDSFAHGTQVIAQAIADSSAFTVVGGGETTAYMKKIGFIERFSFVSTGGGAMLKFLAGEMLPGIEALK